MRLEVVCIIAQSVCLILLCIVWVRLAQAVVWLRRRQEEDAVLLRKMINTVQEDQLRLCSYCKDSFKALGDSHVKLVRFMEFLNGGEDNDQKDKNERPSSN